MVEFTPWGKTPRLFRNTTITEKIDGTNAAVRLIPLEEKASKDPNATAYVQSNQDGRIHAVYAQSRNRFITPESDNYGFAAWIRDNAADLMLDLGPGTHFGEWWGLGIQRGYGLDHKRFSLFNTAKWGSQDFVTPGLHSVPVLFEGTMSTEAVSDALYRLAEYGSHAAPGFDKPEGVIVYHSASGQVFKALIENDGVPKGLTNA